jgi:hypothetical protein
MPEAAGAGSSLLFEKVNMNHGVKRGNGRL